MSNKQENIHLSSAVKKWTAPALLSLSTPETYAGKDSRRPVEGTHTAGRGRTFTYSPS